jgi:hypothetical protein
MFHDLESGASYSSMPTLAAWRKPTRYRQAVVISSLEEEATTLLVPASEWGSYAEAASHSSQPDRVILIEDIPPPLGAQYAVDAIVPDDPDAIASAVRVTDTELADLVSDLPDVTLARIALAPSREALPLLLDALMERIEDADLPRLARAAFVEGRLRASFDHPVRRLLAVSATIPEGVSDASGPAALAAVLLVALLRAGMRMGRGSALRGPEAPPDEVPTPEDVALLLREGVPLPALVPGTRLTFSLTSDEATLVIESSEDLDVRVESGSTTTFAESGRRLTIPLSLLSAPSTTVHLRAADGDDGA